jgi:hypothetical protein
VGRGIGGGVGRVCWGVEWEIGNVRLGWIYVYLRWDVNVVDTRESSGEAKEIEQRQMLSVKEL